MTVCKECGHEFQIGDYPFCKNGEGHQSIFPENASRFPEIVVHKDLATGEYSYPASAREPVPAGYAPVVIRNMREYERFSRDAGAHERAKVVEQRENNRLFFEERTRATREHVDSEMRRRGMMQGRALLLRDRVREFVDKKHAARFSSARSLDVHFHNQALEFNSSNRQSHSGPETNWRERKD